MSRSSQYFCLFVFLLFIISLITNGLLYKNLKKYYTQAKLATVFPSHEQYYQVINTKLEAKKLTRVVLFGDSRIQQWKNPPKLDGYEFINRGIGGESTAQLRMRFEQDVIALKPDVVVLQMGINDLTVVGAAPQLAKRITEQCQNNLEFFINTLQSNKMNTILFTIIPPAQPSIFRLPVWNDQILQRVDYVNQYWLDLPEKKLLQVIDTKKILQDQTTGEWYPGVNKDTLHLTEAGYRYMNDALTSSLKTLATR